MSIIVLLIVLFLLVLMSAFYAASEIAIVSLPESTLAEIRSKHPKMAKALTYHRDDPQRFVINISIANNFINIFASSLATASMVALFPQHGVIIATLGMTFLILMFGEIIPKVLAINKTDFIAKKSAYPLFISAKLLKPFIYFFSLIVRVFAKNTPTQEMVNETTLRYYVRKGFESGAINQDEQEFIQNILHMDSIEVKDIMTSKKVVLSISIKDTVEDAMKKLHKKGYSRAPVYKDSQDTIVGLIHIKDLIFAPKKNKVKKYLRETFFVSGLTSTDVMLQAFQKEDKHMAVVLDQEGIYVGIVTIEDVIEEIVGEIYDETDKKFSYTKQINKNTYHINGGFELQDFNRDFGTNLEGAHTISGYITHKLKKIPEVNEKVKTPAGTFQILTVDLHRVKKVKFTRKVKKIKSTE